MTDAIRSGEDEDLRTVDGRTPGRRGRETRKRLLEVTVEMLRAGSYRDLAVVDIAREADVSPATFYQYFPDVETAIFFIADHIARDNSEHLRRLVVEMDLDHDAMAGARRLAEGFLDVWRDYDAILRVLELGAAERDERFLARRTELLAGPTVALQEAIAARQATGALDHDVNPMALAAVLTAMLAQVSAHRRSMRQWGVTRDEVLEALTRVIHLSLTDRKPDA